MVPQDPENNFLRTGDPKTQIWRMIHPVSEGNPRPWSQREAPDDHRLLSSDYRAAEVATMAMKVFSRAPAPREEEAECTPGALSSECVAQAG